ncbi:MAG: hypothetical protein LC737_00430 [Chloroflexi bacterium]|nr:hypothetical protein [Chloroflexota bacterium]
MDAPQYTTCVDPADYAEPNFTAEIIALVAGLVAALGSGGIGAILSLAAAISAMQKVCDYMLHGKLVCLGGDRCAFGRVAEFETVADKHGPLGFIDKLDNDFSLNLLLSPHKLNEFARGGDSATRWKNYVKVRDDDPKWQGNLIRKQTNLVTPREASDTPADWPDKQYSATFANYQHYNFQDQAVVYPDPDASKPVIKIPIFHCEIEGERAHLVCAALDAISSPIPGLGKVCKLKVFGIPIGKIACAIVGAILFPFVVAGLVAAWFAGSNDNRDFEGAGNLNRGEGVVIMGRWVYDAGHTGWNEIHATKSVQKVSDPAVFEPATFADLQSRWCPLILQAPPLHTLNTGEVTPDTTPEQQGIADNQRKPENRWYLHPAIDGCEPSEPPPPPQPPIIR